MKSKPTLTDLQLTRLFRANLRKCGYRMDKAYDWENGVAKYMSIEISKSSAALSRAIAATREWRTL